MTRHVAITTLGCKVNQFESAAFVSGFEQEGCLMVPFSGKADIYVINTCAVTARAGQQSRQMIRRAMRANPDARIVITGCYAQVRGESLVEMAGERPVCIIGNGNKHLLVETALSEHLADLVMLTGKIGKKKEICPLEVRRFGERSRCYLRIQDGCDNFCSYCIVPYSRGRSRSLPRADVLRQAEVFARQGYREMVVTGINVGKYGLDLDEGEDIYSILHTVCDRHPELRIRLSSVEPTEVNERLLELMEGHDNFMPHLHIPLQSGDDRILARMNRRYTAEVFVQAVRRILDRIPHAAIGCDVVAGFPGEDERAAANTLDLLSALPLAYLHVFPYSRRSGTLAASLPDQVPAREREQRVKALRELSDRKRMAFYRVHQGSIQRVLVESRHRASGMMRGFSENYIPLLFPAPRTLKGQVVRVRFTGFLDDHPRGERENNGE